MTWRATHPELQARVVPHVAHVISEVHAHCGDELVRELALREPRQQRGLAHGAVACIAGHSGEQSRILGPLPPETIAPRHKIFSVAPDRDMHGHDDDLSLI